MQLIRSTDLALRALMATAAADRPVTVATLAAALDVRASHMAKLVQRLRHLGVVTTVRGRRGGVTLAPGARTTSVGQLVRSLEGGREVVDCDVPACPLRAACALRAALQRAQDAFYASLDDVRLDDLVGTPQRHVLVTLLAPAG